MYQTGDRVVYGSHGVCCVASLGERIIDRKIVQYLALEPVGQEGARYLVPTHNPAAMANRELIAGGDRAKLMTMVHAIYRHKAEQTSAGKRCICATKTSCGTRKSC